MKFSVGVDFVYQSKQFFVQKDWSINFRDEVILFMGYFAWSQLLKILTSLLVSESTVYGKKKKHV